MSRLFHHIRQTIVSNLTLWLQLQLQHASNHSMARRCVATKCNGAPGEVRDDLQHLRPLNCIFQHRGTHPSHKEQTCCCTTTITWCTLPHASVQASAGSSHT
jgi:hypothetical protein